MANFIDRLSEVLDNSERRQQLRQTLSETALPHEKELQGLAKKHWHKLPKTNSANRPTAFAVDGSRAVRHLANGAYLFVAQALVVGEQSGSRKEETDADVRILPGATPSPFVDRFAELMMHQLEANLARKYIDKLQAGSVLFLDGALYGQLPQLYPIKFDISDTQSELDTKELLNATVDDILKAYLQLLSTCAEKNVWLISIAKTSREATHAKVWWKHAVAKNQLRGEQMPQEISDSEIIFRWTNNQAGYSTPILLGKRSFTKGSEAVLLEKVGQAPALISFFVRLADYDDALRIDVPACCIGRDEMIGEIESGDEILLDEPKDAAGVEKILQLLMADYGGFEVYNALMYSVDREVRLRQEIMDEVYLSLIQNSLGNDVEVRLDRSERRFHSR